MFDLHLIVGLGNPGRDYHSTRHNTGFMVVEHIAGGCGTTFKKHRGLAELARINVHRAPVLLAKPLTFMNNSGLAVNHLMHHYKIELSRLLVVCDDLALPLGRLRLRGQGSSGGHKGLGSIIEHLHTQQFARLRIGIGPEHPADDTVDFVLSSFSRKEKKLTDGIIQKAVWTVESFITEGLEKTMTLVNSNQEISNDL